MLMCVQRRKSVNWFGRHASQLPVVRVSMGCLVAVLFSAMHALLGAWVVPAVASGPVAEICTPTGMQWVVLDDAPAPDKSWPKGLAQPCVWAMAHVATPPAPYPGQRAPVWNHEPELRLSHGNQWAARLPATAERVLLMAPMRAPPV